MKHVDIVNFNSWAKKHITDDSKFDKDGFIIMENNYNYESTFAKFQLLHFLINKEKNKKMRPN